MHSPRWRCMIQAQGQNAGDVNVHAVQLGTGSCLLGRLSAPASMHVKSKVMRYQGVLVHGHGQGCSTCIMSSLAAAVETVSSLAS